MKKTIALLALPLLSAQGATTWLPADNALSSISWDVFTFSSPVAGDSGTHGGPQANSGGLITSGTLSTEILAPYDVPPGGFLGNPDTYYFHNGGAQWTVTADTSNEVSFVRVSYALLGFGGGAPDAFDQTPEIAGATLIDSGSYPTSSSTVFWADLELDAPANQVSAQFGDIVPPGFFPGSFRSVDAVQVEVFNNTPASVPEPTAPLLSALAGLFLLRRRR
ncbi:MAG: hypothetical protein ACON4R_13725 [Akkermansiaceae bacterium]